MGEIQTLVFEGSHDHPPRRVWVYTPPGYWIPADSNLALVVAFDGREYTHEVPLPSILDTLIDERRVPPCVAVMIADSTGAARLDDLANRAWFSDYVTDELVPWVRARWRVTTDPHRVIVTGSSAGGLAAAHLALRRPEAFGNVLSQSGAFGRGNEASNDPPFEWLTHQVGVWPRKDVRFWLEVGAAETTATLGGTGPSMVSANRAFRDSLVAKGYRVTYTEVPNGRHSSESWAARIKVGLEAILSGK